MKLKIIILVCSLLLAFLIIKADFSIQNSNPIPYLMAVINKVISQDEIVIVWKNPNVYLVDSGNFSPFIEIMEDEGWDFVYSSNDNESLLFERDNETQRVSYAKFTRFYTLINSSIYSDN
ncbi:hypothetical protein [Aerococcus viridans]|uniref:hypothetical protein n=1 Tax=Aerococcus viridans TaxID=1377 RepID=UPI002DB84F77|nr:hypothetical protein [Aerococcus viridans]MEC1387346.1 hypothetical protein [Aerococcus viridans]